MSKNLIITISVIVIVAIVGVGAYFGMHKKGTTTPNVSNQGQMQENQGNQEGGTTTGKLSQLKKIYQGFKEAGIGDWAIWKVPEEGKFRDIKYVYAGQEKINEKDCYGLEFSGKFEGMDVNALEIWFSKESHTPVKFVAKAPQGVFCLSPTMYKPQSGFSPQAGTPDEYKPESIAKLNFEIGTFTTESGKTIKVVKVINPDGSQVWLSSKIAFGIVKAISPDGKTQGELKDFGSGAPLEITKSERDNCQQIPTGLFPGL